MKIDGMIGVMRWFLGLTILILGTACTSEATPLSQPTKPIAIIAAPQNNTNVALGQALNITFTVADVKGIAQVELSIDGQPVQAKKVEPPTNSFAGSHTWQPDKPGSHVIELRAINVDNQSSDPTRVFVNVTGSTDSASTPVPVDTAVTSVDTPAPGTPTVVAITLIPPTASPVAATATPVTLQAAVTTLVGLNVRLGPGTNYPVIGRLTDNQTLPITGRNSEGSWWQITFPLGSNERGWLSANADFTRAANAASVPVVQAPPVPTPAAPTATPTSALPIIQFFRADRDSINPGEVVILSWDLSGAREAFLRYDDISEGVVAPGSKTIAPLKTTVYTLLARGAAGDATAQVTVNIKAATTTPVTILSDGKTRILSGQTIDFDGGAIQQPGAAGADFLWDAQQLKFTPQGGADGAFLGDAFEDITLEDCRTVTYGQPFPTVGSVSRITGCFRTNEGHFGKFFIPEWSADGSLTMEWITWNFR